MVGLLRTGQSRGRFTNQNRTAWCVDVGLFWG